MFESQIPRQQVLHLFQKKLKWQWYPLSQVHEIIKKVSQLLIALKPFGFEFILYFTEFLCLKTQSQ